MLFNRLSWPANENPKDMGLYWGVSRSKSSTRRLMVGRRSICAGEMVVAAPVREELNTGLLVAVTVTGSNSTLAFPSTNRRSAVPPNVRWIWSCSSRRWPTTVTVTRYGPPTRMPEMVNLPSVRVTAAYVVPDGPCTATTRAASSGAPEESVTTPAIAAVVTPWASSAVGTANATVARSRQVLQGSFMNL